MQALALLAQLVVAAGIVNVWVLRPSRATPYRPDGAANLADEFRAYGLPDWARKLTGAAKLSLAALMIVGIWYAPVAALAAAALAVLMLAAVLAHIRVGDPLFKSAPALSMLALCAFVAYANGLA